MPQEAYQDSPGAPGDDISADRLRRIESMAENILKKRDEAVIGRNSSGVERRWREDQDAFDGFDESLRKGSMLDYATGDMYAKANTEPNRSEVLVNIIRGKVETAEGRFTDIQLPVDDRNWALKPTPVPELVASTKDMRPLVTETGEIPQKIDLDGKPTGEPFTVADKARMIMDQAKERMQGMEKEIDDQLTECGYNAECRKVVRDAARLGTGILKGPNIVKKLNRAWLARSSGERTVYVMKVVEEHTPNSKRVDPWNIYPDPNCEDDIRRASYIWEYAEILPRDLRGLMGVEGYLTDQIRKVLDEQPNRTRTVHHNKKTMPEIQKMAVEKGLAYEKWEYHGDVDRDDLIALGVDVSESEMPSLTACVVFVNDRPIKVMLNPLDTGDLPYDFFQWTQVSGSVWGIGISRMGIWWQRIVQAAWRAMMDNSGDSSGANIVVGYGVVPDDGRWEVTGKKIWRVNDPDMMDAQKAFGQFQIDNNQEHLQAIIELALRFFDMETALPMLFQGEQQEMPETLGATNIIVDANNVALRSRVKIWDDQITRPHITRYYHWNMQYNEQGDIKGDWNVDPRGVSELLARDQQAKALIQLLPMRNDPAFQEVDWKKAVRQLFTALHLDILKSDNEEQEQPPPQPVDPRIQTAQIRAESDLKKAELNQTADMEELKFKAEEAERQRQHEREVKSFEFQIKMMEFAEKRDMTLADVKKDLAVEASKQNLMRELADKKTAQMTSPPIEPPQKAPAGEAYQQ